jgi:hypothetical protein
VDLKIVPEESRSQGSQNGICARGHDKESVTEYHGSRNEPLWELKWPLSTCSGWLCRVLRLLRPSSGRAQECSPTAQVKAAAAHDVQTLKQNQREKKVESDFSGTHRVIERTVAEVWE